MTIIHVNSQRIRRREAPIARRRTRTAKADYSDGVVILHGGVEVARIVWQPDRPLPCGARVWIEVPRSCEVVAA